MYAVNVGGVMAVVRSRFMFAINATNGRPNFMFPISGPINSSPVVDPVTGYVYFTSDNANSNNGNGDLWVRRATLQRCCCFSNGPSGV